METTLFDDLHRLVSSYLPDDKVEIVKQAFLTAKSAHDGQFRTSGEPYVTHPIAVASILAIMRLDYETIVAALLHDVIEDTPMGYSEIELHFGHAVAELVEGVSKLDKLKFRNRIEAQTENFRKMIMAMVQDIRVVLIKLADRTHNMRTLGALRTDKRCRIAKETLEIYAPLAHRLGINHLRIELEELSFQALYPNRYHVISKVVQSARGHRREMISRILNEIKQQLDEVGIEAEVTGQEKNLYAIYQKMKLKEQRFQSIMDIYAFHIIVGNNIDSCYRVLGQLHSLYKPRPGLIKDYIAIPKTNGYQALHTSMIGPHGVPVEVRIRTEDMEQMAELGVAACWAQDANNKEEMSGKTVQLKAQRWMQSLLELQQSAGNSLEFIESVKSDLFPDEIYVFTPKGRIVELPAGATPVDFAYAVHTDIGQRCVGAKVDRQPYPLSQSLTSGQTVEIITAQGARPNASWLNFAVSSRARAKIRQSLKQLKRSDAIILGQRLLNYALGDESFVASLSDKDYQPVLNKLKVASVDDLWAEIGLGNVMSVVAAEMLRHRDIVYSPHANGGKKLLIRGADGVLLTLARCCHPIPFDPIVGYINPGKGLVIHHEHCGNIVGHEELPEKYVAVEWEKEPEQEFIAELRLELIDKQGVLASLIVVINSEHSNIHGVNTMEKEGRVQLVTLLIGVRDHQHLASIMRKLSLIPDVVSVHRNHN